MGKQKRRSGGERKKRGGKGGEDSKSLRAVGIPRGVDGIALKARRVRPPVARGVSQKSRGDVEGIDLRKVLAEQFCAHVALAEDVVVPVSVASVYSALGNSEEAHKIRSVEALVRGGGDALVTHLVRFFRGCQNRVKGMVEEATRSPNHLASLLRLIELGLGSRHYRIAERACGVLADASVVIRKMFASKSLLALNKKGARVCHAMLWRWFHVHTPSPPASGLEDALGKVTPGAGGRALLCCFSTHRSTVAMDAVRLLLWIGSIDANAFVEKHLVGPLDDASRMVARSGSGPRPESDGAFLAMAGHCGEVLGALLYHSVELIQVHMEEGEEEEGEEEAKGGKGGVGGSGEDMLEKVWEALTGEQEEKGEMMKSKRRVLPLLVGGKGPMLGVGADVRGEFEALTLEESAVQVLDAIWEQEGRVFEAVGRILGVIAQLNIEDASGSLWESLVRGPQQRRALRVLPQVVLELLRASWPHVTATAPWKESKIGALVQSCSALATVKPLEKDGGLLEMGSPEATAVLCATSLLPIPNSNHNAVEHVVGMLDAAASSFFRLRLLCRNIHFPSDVRAALARRASALSVCVRLRMATHSRPRVFPSHVSARFLATVEQHMAARRRHDDGKERTPAKGRKWEKGKPSPPYSPLRDTAIRAATSSPPTKTTPSAKATLFKTPTPPPPSSSSSSSLSSSKDKKKDKKGKRRKKGAVSPSSTSWPSARTSLTLADMPMLQTMCQRETTPSSHMLRLAWIAGVGMVRNPSITSLAARVFVTSIAYSLANDERTARSTAAVILQHTPRSRSSQQTTQWGHVRGITDDPESVVGGGSSRSSEGTPLPSKPWVVETKPVRGTILELVGIMPPFATSRLLLQAAATVRRDDKRGSPLRRSVPKSLAKPPPQTILVNALHRAEEEDAAAKENLIRALQHASREYQPSSTPTPISQVEVSQPTPRLLRRWAELAAPLLVLESAMEGTPFVPGDARSPHRTPTSSSSSSSSSPTTPPKTLTKSERRLTRTWHEAQAAASKWPAAGLRRIRDAIRDVVLSIAALGCPGAVVAVRTGLEASLCAYARGLTEEVGGLIGKRDERMGVAMRRIATIPMFVWETLDAVGGSRSNVHEGVMVSFEVEHDAPIAAPPDDALPPPPVAIRPPPLVPLQPPVAIRPPSLPTKPPAFQRPGRRLFVKK